jgi:hypothetical protein
MVGGKLASPSIKGRVEIVGICFFIDAENMI